MKKQICLNYYYDPKLIERIPQDGPLVFIIPVQEGSPFDYLWCPDTWLLQQERGFPCRLSGVVRGSITLPLQNMRGYPLPVGPYLESSFRQFSRPALFLDRDGVIIEDAHYLKDPNKIRFIEDTVSVMKLFQRKGYLLIVLSNQAGIAKGLITESENRDVTESLDRGLQERGVHIDEFFYCPYHPDAVDSVDAKYKTNLFWRKPYPGMVFSAMNKFAIDLSQSLMIGDRKSDCLSFCPIDFYLLQGKYPLCDINNAKIFLSSKEMLDYFKDRGLEI